MYREEILSPCLRRLDEEIRRGNKDALDEFWKKIGAEGSPVFEDIEGDKGNCLATVIWRQTREVDNIFVFGEVFGGEMFGEAGKKTNLSRLPDTDLWYRSVIAPRDARSLYILIANVDENYDWKVEDIIVDPLNPKKYTVPVDKENPENCPLLHRTESIMEFPDAVEKVWIKERDDGKKGQIDFKRFKSRILDNERRVWVYTPHCYNKEDASNGLIVFTDGWEYINLVKAPEILDNLICDNHIPPMCAVFIESLENRSQELTFNPEYLKFLTDEILPWIKEDYSAGKVQSKTVIAGFSLGGLLASYAAFTRPDIFGKVLSQSGAFYYRVNENGQAAPDMDGGCEMAEQYASAEKLPIDFYLNVGIFEEIFPYHIKACSKMVETLRSKGYKVAFEKFPGGHIYLDWQDNLASGLKALIGKP